MRDDPERLRDILKAGTTPFANNWRGSQVSDRTISAAPSDRVWSKSAGMRHILVHHYFEIDADLVWKVVENDLPELRRIVISILMRESEAPGP